MATVSATKPATAAGRVRATLTELLAARGVTLDAAALDSSLQELGLDSLHVVELQLELEEAFGVELGESDQVERALGTMKLGDLVAHVASRLVAAPPA